MKGLLTIGLSLLVLMSMFSSEWAFGYRRAVEGKDNVKNKIYPRKKRVEISPYAGLILNQSYIQTFLVGGGLTYNLSDEWGISFDASITSNSDKGERTCIENFYRDPDSQLAAPCDEEGNGGALEELGSRDDGRTANYGPAYVPIREIENILFLNTVWTPVYGKQLVFLSFTSYFDLYFEFGGGLVNSLFYPEQPILKNGLPARGVEDTSSDEVTAGAEPEDTYAYGIEGRPEAESQSNPTINLGIGQKFHFFNKAHLKISLRNMTLLGTHSTFENLFVLKFGVGLRF